MIYRITLEVHARDGQAVGIKEQLAMEMERWGVAQVVQVEEIQEGEQLHL